MVERPQPVLILAPHFDDAVLSAFALLRLATDAPADSAASGAPVETHLATVFTGEPVTAKDTGWDRLCGFASSSEACRARRRENAAALAGLGVHEHDLGLLDLQYLDGPRDPSDDASIARFVEGWLDAHGPGAVVAAPAGAGRQVAPTTSGRSVFGAPRSERRASIRRAVGPAGRRILSARARVVARRTPPFAHPDHVLVRDAAARAVADRQHGGLLLYEDLPYLWGAPADGEAASLGRRTGLPVTECRCSIDQQEKASRVAAYRSQLRYMYAPRGPLDAAAGLPPVERYWAIGADNGGFLRRWGDVSPSPER